MDKDDHPQEPDTSIERRERDRDDLNNEMAGREVGRVRRFLPEGSDPASLRKRREREREYRSRLMALLQSSTAYAALYQETKDTLRKAEAATEIALAEARDRITGAQEAVAGLRDKASTLPDGAQVYRDAEGNVRTEDGTLVEGDDLDRITWREGAPSYEDIAAARRAAADAQANYDAILRYQTDVLGRARDRLTDEDNPPTMDEIRDIQQRITEEAPFTRQNTGEPTEAAPDLVLGNSTGAKLPPIGS